MVSHREIKDWYDRKHRVKGEDTWRPCEAYPIFLNYLDVEPGKRLLDIGCGTGYLLKEATEMGLETTGIDISDEAVRIAGKASPGSRISVGRGEELRFADGSFDYVTCIGVLEHFLDIEKGVSEIVRVGKNDALFLIVVPNRNFLLWKITSSGTEQQDINEKLMSLKEWKSVFVKEGLEMIGIYQDRWHIRKVNVFSSINPLSIIKKAIHKLVWAFLPLNYTYQFIFVLRKRSMASSSLNRSCSS